MANQWVPFPEMLGSEEEANLDGEKMTMVFIFTCLIRISLRSLGDN